MQRKINKQLLYQCIMKEVICNSEQVSCALLQLFYDVQTI